MLLLGNPDGVAPDSSARSVSSGRGVPTPCTCRRSPLRNIAQSTRGRVPSADISHPEFRVSTFHIRNFVRRHFTFGYLTAGWERRTFQLLRSDISRSSDSVHPESIRDRHFRLPGFCTVPRCSPELPDICHRLS